jgi:hypothetical protein
MGENSVRSGRDGEKITKEILKLIGWDSIACNFDIECSFPSKHKAKTHGVDVLYSYDNPLYHNKREIIIGSVKHFENGYPSNKKSQIQEHILELCTNLSCLKASDQILKLVGKSPFETRYKGLLFWLSSSNDESQYNMIENIETDIDFENRQFEEIYIVDNKKATFLISCIKTAESYFNGQKVQFLYQNTGKNMDKDQLLITGNQLPVQLINSEIIPIVKESNGKISCLIFCANPYSQESLSRLIWFSHKLCGLTNEIRLYFPDYNNNKEYEVNTMKQTFKDETLTSKITAHRMSFFDFISLKETQNHNNNFSKEIQQSNAKNLVHSEKIIDDIEKILPYGDLLLPKLKTGILSETNLRYFLFKKGIVTNKKSKDEILPIFSCLLLSPNELDNLKATYKEKEDKPKEIERNATANLGDQTLWEVFNEKFNDLKTLNNLKLPKNCSMPETYTIERVNNDYNNLHVKYQLEKTNTNKDFLTGKTRHDGEIEIKYNNGELAFFDRHTSPETYQFNKDFHNKFEKTAKKHNLIPDSFKSISFLDFDNKKRIQFLLSFFELRNSNIIRIINMVLEDMRFRPDETMGTLPDDLDSLKGRVSQLNLHGKELNDTIYLSREEYKSAILCEKVKYYIHYNYMNRNGICLIDVAFSGALSRNDYNDSALQISITPSNNSYDTNFASTKTKIVQEISRIKKDNYLKFKR